MHEYVHDALEELKRADHLIFVSLKYTRTADILKHTIERLIAAFDFAFDGLLDELMEKKEISELPKAPLKKASMIKLKYSSDPEIAGVIDFYLLLRKLNRAKFERSNEYRRHVTMTALLEDGPSDVTIDVINEYYKTTFNFINHLATMGEHD